MRAMIRRLLLIMLFLLAQAGALGHAIGHASEPEDQGLDHQTACELCMAYAPLGAGVASTPIAHSPPPALFHFNSVPLPGTFAVFRRAYLSRAPPL